MNERDMRGTRGMDGRNPYGSRGGYVTTHRPRRGDRGMDYRDMARSQPRTRSGRYRRDYGEEDMRRDMGVQHGYGTPQSGDVRYNDGMRDMRHDYGMDGHYQHGRQSGYEPVEFMGYCQGYYGSPDHGDYRGGRDYGYDMRGGYGRRDYGYDYGYDDYGDYGETLSEKELEHWNKKLMEQLDEREKQMFSKDAIMQKIKQMNIPMDGFGEKELYTATLAMYTDHKTSIGQNPELAIKLGRDFLTDKDSNVKGAERLCVYYDTFVED